MKVGALADRTGLTVRTLHHYHDIGLLSPAERTAAGHRLYGPAEVERLQRIASLRQLGLSLEEVGACLDRPDLSLERVLEMHLQRLREEIARQEDLVRLLEDLREGAAAGEELSVDHLVATIAGSLRVERYYSGEQLSYLAERAERVGPDRIREVQGEWERLFGAFEDAMRRGVDPAADEVRGLTDRAAALVDEFTGGDPGVVASLHAMYEAEGPGAARPTGPSLPDGLWEYMGRAREAR